MPIVGLLIFSVVVGYLHVVRIAINESETNPPLIVDRDRMLPLPVPFERVEPVAGRRTQIAKPSGKVDIFQLSHRAP
jgi:hypothetical protein